jgi:hypothetical protein
VENWRPLYDFTNNRNRFKNYEATYAPTSYPFIHATGAEKSRTGSDASPSSSTSDLKKHPSTETFGEDVDEVRDVELG